MIGSTNRFSRHAHLNLDYQQSGLGAESGKETAGLAG